MDTCVEKNHRNLYKWEVRSMGVQAQNGNERLRTIWTPEMVQYFIYLMLEQVGKGNKFDDHLFSKRSWKHMSSMFNAKFKSQYEKDVLKNRHKTLTNLYRTVTKLLAHTGFSWDEKRKMVHPDARSYRIKSIPYFSDLCTIYVHVPTAEKGATRCAAVYDPPVLYFKDVCVIYDPTFDEKESPRPDLAQRNSVEDKSMEEYETGLSPAVSNYIEYHDSNVWELTHTREKHKRQLEIDSTCPKRLRGDEQGMAVTLQEMATTISSVSTKTSDDNSVPIEIVIEAVQALPDMDEDLVLDACDFLEDEKKATFLALDVKLRKKWLLRKLRT